jgi:putative transcriptional regulator
LRIAEFLRLPLDAVFSLQPFPSMSEQMYPRNDHATEE